MTKNITKFRKIKIGATYKNVQEWGFIAKRPDGLYKRFWNEQEFKLIK